MLAVDANTQSESESDSDQSLKCSLEQGRIVIGAYHTKSKANGVLFYFLFYFVTTFWLISYYDWKYCKVCWN